jgi:hypothetical protein
MTVQQNNRTNNRIVTAFGVRMAIAEWARVVGVTRDALAARIDKLGWSPERAVGLHVAGI